MSSMFLLPVLGIPLAILAVSYALLVREFGTWRLWHVTVHESGRRTLRETVFYYNHFLRELPLDTLFAAAILSSYSAADLRIWQPASAPISPLPILGLFLAWVIVGSIRSVGLPATLSDLFQVHETDERRGWGSHWQMHFLSTAVLLLLFLLPAAMFEPLGPFVFRAAPLAAAFLALSAIFRTGLKSLTDRRWVLHGAREAVTYGAMLAVPLFVPLLGPEPMQRLTIGSAAIAILACLVLITGYFLFVRLQSDLNAEASSSRGVVFLLSSHFFEHILDSVYIFLVVLAVTYQMRS
jgi:hypothetical protein